MRNSSVTTPTPSSVTAAPSRMKYPRVGDPSVRAIVRVTSSYVNRDGAVECVSAMRGCLGGRRDDACEIRDRGLRVQTGEHVIAARVSGELRDPRVPVVEIAEDDRIRRAGLLARGDDVPACQQTCPLD